MMHTIIDAFPRFKGKSAGSLYGDVVEEFDYETGCLLDVLDELGARLILRDLMEKLKSVGVSAKLIIREGKRHGWKEGIETELSILADWLMEPFKSGGGNE